MGVEGRKAAGGVAAVKGVVKKDKAEKVVRRKKNLEKVVRRKNLEKVVASIPVEEVLEEPVEVVIEKKRDLAKADRTQFLDRAQTERAVTALLKFENALAEKGKDWNGDKKFVSILVGTKTMMPNRLVKPRRIPLQTPLYKAGDAEICFIVKDPQRTMKDYFAEHGNCGVTKVLGVKKLRARYKSFEAKRHFCSQYDLFLADNRVLPVLPRLLGKEFFRSKKVPAPINMQRNVKAELEAAIGSTYIHLGAGNSTAVKVGTVDFTADELIDNILISMDAILQKIPGGPENIQNVYLKTTDSVALPLFNSLPTKAPSSIPRDPQEE